MAMVRRKNVIATVAQSFAVTCVVTVVWMAITYGMSFGVNPDENLNKYVGSFDVLFLNGVTTETAFSAAKGLPEMLWIVYQMTFAIITPALIAGAFAERMKSGPSCSSPPCGRSSSTRPSVTGSGAAAGSRARASWTSPAAPSFTSMRASPA